MSHPAPATPAIRPQPSLPARKAVALIGGALIAHQVVRRPESRAHLLALVELANAFGVLTEADNALILKDTGITSTNRRLPAAKVIHG